MHYLLGLRRHYVVLPALGLAYARIPKAANSTIKRMMARAGGIEDMFDAGRFSKDAYWRTKAPHARFMTAREMRRAYPDIFVFTFVREPLARLASCYRSKIGRAKEIPASFRREGLSPDASFRDFAEHVAARPDWRSNIHYRAQAHILGAGRIRPPDFIGRFETLTEDWARLRETLAARGVDLPEAPRRKTNPNRPPVLRPGDLFDGDQALMARLRARYADDYRYYYPERLSEEAS